MTSPFPTSIQLPQVFRIRLPQVFHLYFSFISTTYVMLAIQEAYCYADDSALLGARNGIQKL